MKDDRFRVPVDEEYLLALGRATYVFANLEWNAVWCCELLQPNVLNQLEKRTAGIIADRFVELVELSTSTDVQRECMGPAVEFRQLTREKRNAILHGRPATTPGDTQQISRYGDFWSIEKLNDAADEFAACSVRLNGLLQGVLKL